MKRSGMSVGLIGWLCNFFLHIHLRNRASARADVVWCSCTVYGFEAEIREYRDVSCLFYRAQCKNSKSLCFCDFLYTAQKSPTGTTNPIFRVNSDALDINVVVSPDVLSCTYDSVPL